MQPLPILFLGDSPSLRTGLARIGRYLASSVATMPEYRVGFLGRGGVADPRLPFFQATFNPCDQWGEHHLEHVWRTFAGDRRGVIFTIWDAARLLWFARPLALDPSLMRFLGPERTFERWGYFPVDATGPRDRLTATATATIAAYERPLAYTIWGAQVIGRSIGRECDWIPHGIRTDIFKPHEKAASRMALGFSNKDLVTGCIMANQPRKDWGLAFALMSRLHDRNPRVRFWAHVDVMDRSGAWSIPALIADFHAQDWTLVTSGSTLDDERLAVAYSGCDLTILPSLGEGFGFPLAESLSCGVPVVHGNYAGGAEIVRALDPSWLVEPRGWRLAERQNCLRPVFEPQDWVDLIERKVEEGMPPVEQCRDAVSHLDFGLLWKSCWKRWFEEGARRFES